MTPFVQAAAYLARPEALTVVRVLHRKRDIDGILGIVRKRRCQSCALPRFHRRSANRT